MKLRRVPREVTEAAIQYLHATYLDHVRAMSATPQMPGRVLRNASIFGVSDAYSASRQSCFLRMISVVEAYVDTVCAALFREKTPTTDELVRRLVESAELRASTTWQERKEAYAKYHDISLGGLSRWSELDAGIAVRNAIAHGLGQLTPQQRTTATAQKMTQLGVTLRDGGVFITDTNLQRCRDVCIAFIHSLDNVLPQNMQGT